MDTLTFVGDKTRALLDQCHSALQDDLRVATQRQDVGRKGRAKRAVDLLGGLAKDQVVDELLDSGRIVCVSLLNELAHVIGMVLDHFSAIFTIRFINTTND